MKRIIRLATTACAALPLAGCQPGASAADIRLQQTVELKGTPVSKPLREHYLSESIVSL